MLTTQKKMGQLQCGGNSEGFGDTVKKVTTIIGIPTCEGCEARRIWLNKMFPYVKEYQSEEVKHELE